MTKLLASCLSLLVIVSGCGAGTTIILPSQSATSQPQTSAPSGGTWSGTVSYEWTTHTVVSGTDTTETTDVTYAAHAQVASSQAVVVDRWKVVSGQATINSSSSRISDFTISTCHNHFDDEATASETVSIVDGGVEIDGNHYNIRVEIPSITGSETSLRQYSSGCGISDTDTHDWAVADYTVLESGTMTDPNVISGAETGEAGQKTTWELHRTP